MCVKPVQRSADTAVRSGDGHMGPKRTLSLVGSVHFSCGSGVKAVSKSVRPRCDRPETSIGRHFRGYYIYR